MKKLKQSIVAILLISIMLFGMSVSAAPPTVPTPSNSDLTVKLAFPTTVLERGQTYNLDITFEDFSSKVTTDGIAFFEFYINFNKDVFSSSFNPSKLINYFTVKPASFSDTSESGWDFGWCSYSAGDNKMRIGFMVFTESYNIRNSNQVKLSIPFTVKDDAPASDEIYFWANSFGFFNSNFSDYKATGSYVAMSLSRSETEYTSGAFTYALYDDKTAEVKSVSSSAESLTVPSTVTKDGVSYTVKVLRDNSFAGATALKNLFIPCTVTTIGNIKSSYGTGFNINSCAGSAAQAFATSKSLIFNKDTSKYQQTAKVEATCTQEGSTTFKCPDCTQTHVTTQPAKGHSFGSWTTTKQPTYEEEGEKRRDCQNCDHFETEVIPKLIDTSCKHTNTKTEHKDPTCTAAGYDKVICNDCSEVISNTPIAATGHTPGTVQHQDPTCTVEGYDRQYCTTCTVLVSETKIAKTAHTPGTAQHQDPTCTAEGYDRQYCTVCNTLVSDKKIAKKAHTPGAVQHQDPTCSTAGYDRQYCTVCNELVVNNTIAKKAHTPGAVQHQDPTCSTAGYDRQYCTVCNELVVNNTIAKKPHTPGTMDEKAATCLEDGYRRQKCTVCNDWVVNETLAKKAHTFDDWTVTKEATEDEDGERQRTCAACGTVETEVIPALGSESSEESIGEESSQAESSEEASVVEESSAPASSTDTSVPTSNNSEEESPNTQRFVLILILVVISVLAVGYAVIMFIRKRQTY